MEIVTPYCVFAPRCSSIPMFQLNKSCYGSRYGMNFLFFGRSKNSPISGFFTPNSTNDCTRQPSNNWYSIFGWSFFSFFFKDVPSYFIVVIVAWDWGAQAFWWNISDFSLFVKKSWILSFFPQLYNSAS